MLPLALEPRHATALRRGLVLACCCWALLYLRRPDAFGLLDAVDLPIHETGHLVFAPFGTFVGYLGGTLLQLILPLAFVLHFAWRGDRFAAWLVTGWVAQNLWNVARYIGDARSRLLPLVGGGEHDWNYLLGETNLLAADQTLATAVRAAGIFLFWIAMTLAFLNAEADSRPVEAGVLTPGAGQPDRS